MISYVHSTTVCVSDQVAALDFYVNTLEWEKVIDAQMGESMHFITVRPVGSTTEIALGQAEWFEDERSRPGTNGISLATGDIDATVATLEQRGVKFKGPIEDMPWGDRETWFYDPDGNEFFLVEG